MWINLMNQQIVHNVLSHLNLRKRECRVDGLCDLIRKGLNVPNPLYVFQINILCKPCMVSPGVWRIPLAQENH